MVEIVLLGCSNGISRDLRIEKLVALLSRASPGEVCGCQESHISNIWSRVREMLL